MRESKEGGGRHRWRWILLGAIVALLLLIVLLPTLLSTGPGRRLLVGVANARMDGSVAMESCSLGWLSGFKFRGLKVSNEKGAELASVDALSISASVPQLLGSIKKLGTVQVEGPRVTVDLSEPEGPTPSGEEEPRAQEEAERLPFDLTGTVKVTGGWITVKDGQAQLLDLKNLSGEAGIEGLSRPIGYSVQGDVADGGGRFTAKGSVRVAKDGKPGAEALKGNVEAALKRLDLSLLQPFIQRTGAPLAIAVLDLDHFKDTNDRYGHAAGDAVLCVLATCLRRTLRETDLAGRLGGEEFGLLLVDTDLAGAESLLQRLREQIAVTPVAFEGRSLSLSASIGLARCRLEDDGIAEALSRADRALYVAKREGRNRVRVDRDAE